MRSLYSLIVAIAFAAPAFAADPACKYVADANAKIYTVPTHVYMTQTAAFTGGKPRSSEIIYLKNKSYVQVSGKWHPGGSTQEDLDAVRKKANEPNQNITCRVTRDEAINGEQAALYTIHEQTTVGEKIDSQIWISKSRGLPLKLEMDMDVGGMAGKSHRTMRYEYSNVQAPAGLQ